MTAFGKPLRSFIPSALALGLALTIAADASARAWKPDAKSAAQDYTQIVHHKTDTDLVMLWWLAPQFLPPTSQSAPLAQLLDEYVIIGIVEAHISPTRTVFDPIESLNVADGNGMALKALSSAEMPSTLANGLVILQRVMTQSAGPLGQGIHWFVFERGAVHSCGIGALAVAYGGELYTYDTPIPGCPKI